MCNQTSSTKEVCKAPGWHSYGEEAPNPALPNYKTVFVLTCACQTGKSSTIWTTLHPSRDAVLTYIGKEQTAHQSRGEVDNFSCDIYEAVLDIRKVCFHNGELLQSRFFFPATHPDPQ